MDVFESFIDFLVHGLKWLIQSTWGGPIFLLLGVLSLWYCFKHPYKKGDVSQGDIQGWAGSIGFILLGLLIMYWKYNERL